MNYLSLVVRAAPPFLLRTVFPITRNFHALQISTPAAGPFRTLAPLPTPHILQPINPLLMLSCGMKQKGVLKKRCKDCYFVMRQGRLYVLCNTKPRHKQMAMKKAERNTWILTHATQSPKRPW